MAEKPMVEEEETSEESETLDEDKTSEEKNEEVDSDEDKSGKDGEKKKPSSSEIAQKIKWRDKYQKEHDKVSKLETQFNELKALVKKPADDAEARAQDYIREQARKVFEELNEAKKAEEKKITEDFDEKVAAVLETNPDVSEEEILDIIEEYEVEPETAIKILKKQSQKKPKPKMPNAKRGSGEVENRGKPDDTKKSFWDILKEERAKLKE